MDSTAVSVAPSGTGTFTINKVILVQNRSGAFANRVLKYDYDPLTAFAEFHRVNIYKANGEVRPVDVGKTLDYKAPARMIYWGARQIMLELGRLDPGDIIEYEIPKKGFTYALLTDCLLYTSHPVRSEMGKNTGPVQRLYRKILRTV